jgi:hypothetical protein
MNINIHKIYKRRVQRNLQSNREIAKNFCPTMLTKVKQNDKFNQTSRNRCEKMTEEG